MIGFACSTIFHYQHLRKIASHFGREAIFINCTHPLDGASFERLNAFLTNEGVPHCGYEAVLCGDIRLTAVVAPHYLNLFHFLDERVPRIRVLYGYAKDVWNYAVWNKGFDLCLAYGAYAEERLLPHVPTVSVGHPRYEPREEGRLAAEVPDMDGNPLSEWLAQDTGREVILYCPTWSELTSIPVFIRMADRLLERYRVIVKLHHGNLLTDGIDLSLFRRKEFFVCDETVDLFDLFPVSRLVLSDYSGAIFDAMLAEKAIVLINHPEAHTPETRLSTLNRMGLAFDGISDPTVSLDVKVREFLPQINSPDEAIPVITANIGKGVNGYGHLLDKLYAYRDGLAPLRCHREIRAFVRTFGARAARRRFQLMDMERLNRFIRSHGSGPFSVWGIGDVGRMVVLRLRKEGAAVKDLIDGNPGKQGQVLDGIRIRSPLDADVRGSRIIIAAPTGAASIEKELIGRGLVPGEDFLNPFGGQAV